MIALYLQGSSIPATTLQTIDGPLRGVILRPQSGSDWTAYRRSPVWRRMFPVWQRMFPASFFSDLAEWFL